MTPRTLPEINALLATDQPPELGPGPRAGIRSAKQLNDALEKIFVNPKLSERSVELIRAVVLLWHDHLDEAHLIAQVIEGRDGSFVHAIMHRREPDYGNAKYWLHHTDAHPCFPDLAARAAALLAAEGEGSLREKLISRGNWDPFAFVDACSEAARELMTDRQVRLLREIQRIETEVLLEYLLSARI